MKVNKEFMDILCELCVMSHVYVFTADHRLKMILDVRAFDPENNSVNIQRNRRLEEKWKDRNILIIKR